MCLRKVLLVLTIIVALCSCSKQRLKRQSALRERETNAVNFIRLVVMRLIYGVATRIGLEDNISGALNGAFVPPGVDNDDYGLDQLLKDDYDY